MNDDELRSRLARLDPQADVPVAPITPEQKEHAMTTTAPTPTATPPRSRKPLLAAAAVAVLALGGGGLALALTGDDDEAPAKAPTVLALTAAPSNVLQSCLPVSADALRDAQVAFAGTVTSVTGTSATLDVTQWFRGGDADAVSVSQEGGTDAVALDGVAFAAGAPFLVTANDGVVRSCSNSGPDTPELRALFEQAFTG